MTAPTPITPPVLNPYGRTAKELLSTTPSQAGAGGTPDVVLPFHARLDGSVTLTDAPAAVTAITGYAREWFDAKYFSHARLCVDVEVAGPTGASVVGRYAPDYDLDPATYAVATLLGNDLAVPIDVVGAQRSAWVALDPSVNGPLRDVVWQLFSAGGDGATDAKLGKASIQFRRVPPHTAQRFYLRNVIPQAGAGLSSSQYLSATDLFLRLGYPGDQLGGPWNPPDDIAVPAGGVGALMTTKGASEVAAHIGSTTGSDVRSHACSWVGPPLMGGQTIPFFYPRVAYKGTSLWHAWPIWSAGIWRPGVGFVSTLYRLKNTRDYFGRRFVPLNLYEYEVLLEGSMSALTQDGDRWVLGLDLIIEGAFGASFGQVHYNGVTEPVHGLNRATDAASYIDLPLLNYLTLNP